MEKIGAAIGSLVFAVILWYVLVNIVFTDPCIRWSFNGAKQEFCLGK